MSSEITTALIAAGSGLIGSLATYAGLRAQLRESRKKDKRHSERELDVAEYDYLARIQDMLIESAQHLVAANADHTKAVIALEREKNKAEEELRYAKIQHEQALRAADMLNDEEVLKARRCVQEKEVLEGEIRRLMKVLRENGLLKLPDEEPLRP